MPDPLMRLQNVDRTFHTPDGDARAVQGLNMSLLAGQVTALVGESGSGKTTAARMISGLEQPSAGTIEYQGVDISQLSGNDLMTYRLGVQYIHQDPYSSLNPTRTVENALSASLRRHRLVARSEVRHRVRELLTEVGLTPAENYLGKFPHQLSGGQRQRATIARALTTEPKLIVADECTSMLDVSIRVSVLDLLAKLRDEKGVGFLFITHDLAMARFFGWHGWLAVMYLGRIVEEGPTREVLAHPAHPYTRALINAIPEADPRLTRRKSGTGLRSTDVPSLLALPRGCAFHTRCPMYRPGLCDTSIPALVSGPAPTHQVACFRADQIDVEMPQSTRPGVKEMA